jgi:tight adherence protein B
MLAEIFTGLTFVLVFSIIFGLYWSSVMRTEASEIARFQSRVAAAARLGSGAPRASLVREVAPLSAIAVFDAVLARMALLIQPLRQMVERSRLRTTVGTVILASLALFAGVFAAVLWFTGVTPLAFFLGVAAGATPFLVLHFARQRLIRKLEGQLPEAMDLIARSLRAGHAFSSGLKLAGDEIPDPLGAEFRALHDRHSFGQPLPQALREFAERVEIIDARFFVTAVLTQREAGGNLAEVLDHLSWVVRDRFRIKREVQSKSAHGRVSGAVLAAMPPLLFVYGWLSDPQRMLTFVTDPLGTRLVVGALIFQVIGTIVIRKITKIRY